MARLKKIRFNYSWISECRGVLMGFAALWVVLFHSPDLSFAFLRFKPLFVGLDFFKGHGNAGVDVFLLLSGLGLYYSLEKNRNISEFYKRRFFRVFPSAVLVALLYYGIFEQEVSILRFLADVLFLGFYKHGRREFWYFSLILVLYIFYPLLHRFIKSKPAKRIPILIVFAVLFNGLLTTFVPDYYKMIEIAVSRIPIFLVGVWLGVLSRNRAEVSFVGLMTVAAVLLIGSFSVFYFCPVRIEIERILCGVIGFSMVIILTLIFHCLKTGAIKRILAAVGTYSMEIYLLYEKVSKSLSGKLFHDRYNFCFYLVVFTITLVMSVLLKNTVDSLLSVSKKQSLSR